MNRPGPAAPCLTSLRQYWEKHYVATLPGAAAPVPPAKNIDGTLLDPPLLLPASIRPQPAEASPDKAWETNCLRMEDGSLRVVRRKMPHEPLLLPPRWLLEAHGGAFCRALPILDALLLHLTDIAAAHVLLDAMDPDTPQETREAVWAKLHAVLPATLLSQPGQGMGNQLPAARTESAAEDAG